MAIMETEMTNNLADILWDEKHEWHRRGKDFLIVVKHHTEETPSLIDYDEGPHRWCVYAYVYPRHPHFANFSGPDMFQNAAHAMPFHAYPSFLRWHRDDDGDPASVQVGADYHHLHDERFAHYATKDEAHEVFADAAELHAYLTNYTKE